MGDGFSSQEVLSLGSIDNALYAGTLLNGIFVLNGGSWLQSSAGLPSNLSVYALNYHAANSILYAGTNDGVYKKRAQEHGWTKVKGVDTEIYSLCSRGDDLYVSAGTELGTTKKGGFRKLYTK